MLFLGAGASKPLGIPTMEGFTDEVIAGLTRQDSNSADFVKGIQDAVSELGFKPDIEAILTVLSGVTDPDRALYSVGPMLALFTNENAPRFESLNGRKIVSRIEDIIYDRCEKIDHRLAIDMFGNLFRRLEENISLPNPSNRNSFTGSWQIDQRMFTRRIFTTNYDLSIEAFLRNRSIRFTDGFQPDDVMDYAFTGAWDGDVRLYKLHGSINYFMKGDGKIVRLPIKPEKTDFYGETVAQRMMIYPVGEKYSTKHPYFDYLYQLRTSLPSENSCIVIGYSFRDIPINNAFEDAVKRNRNLRVLLVSPSASKIREHLDEDLKTHVSPIDLPFEDQRTLDTIISILNNFRLPHWN